MRNNTRLTKKIANKENSHILITADNSLRKSQYKTYENESINVNNSNSFSKTKTFLSQREKTIYNNNNYNNTNNLKLSLNPYFTQSNFRLTKNKILSPQHSIFNRFQQEFKKSFNKSINDTKENFSLSIYKYQPQLFPTRADKEKIKRYQRNKKKKKQSYFHLSLKKDSNEFDDENEEMEFDEISEETYEPSVKTITFSQPSNILKYKKLHKRKRDFQIYKDEKYIKDQKWKHKLGIKIVYKFNSYLENDLKFQSEVIKDELSIILDNIQYYKSTCLSNSNIIPSFKNKELKYQVHINKMLEETNFLLNMIPKIILKEYYDYNERFIAIEGAKNQDFKTTIVYDESEVFIINGKLLNKIGSFLRCCFDVYIDLISQVEDNMIIKKKDFDLLLSIFEKTRYFIGELTISGKNAIKDLDFDRKLIQKYKTLVIKKKDVENEVILPEHIDIGEKMSKDLQFKKNETSQKLQRIANSLNSHKKEDITKSLKQKRALMMMKTKNGPMGLINSQIMTKMLKYLNKDIRGKIISLRTIDRIQQNSQNN